MPHKKLDILTDKGFVILNRVGDEIDPAEWTSPTYHDWKSGGDTNFAVLASAVGDEDPHGFWEHGKPDKDGVWTPAVMKSPSLQRWVEHAGTRFGRVRIRLDSPCLAEPD